MAAWDNSYVSPPGAASYAAPLLDFSPLSKLADDYMKGTQDKRTLALQGAFKDGLPKNSDGTLDIGSMSNTLAKLGGADSAMPLMQLQIQQQLGQGNAAAVNSAAGGVNGGGNTPQPVPPHGIPTNTGNAQPASQPVAQGEGTNPQTLANVVQAQVKDPAVAGRVMTALAGKLGIDPGQPVNPNDPTIAAYIKAANGGVVPNGLTAGQQPVTTGQAPQQAAPQAQPQPAQPQQPPQFAQANGPQAAPAGMDEGTANRLDQASAQLRARASAVGKFDAQGAQSLDKQADAYDARAKQIRDYISKSAEPTPEQKNATASGLPNPVAYEQTNAQNKNDVTMYGKQLGAIQGSASAANRMLQHIQLAEGLYKDPNFYSGAGENLNLMYKRVVNALNPNNTEALPQEAFRKTMAASVLNQVEQLKDDTAAAGGGGRIFQAQIDLMEKAANNPDNSIPANRLLTEISKRGAMMSKQVASMANSYNGGHLDAKFAQKIDDYYSQHPMFSDAEMNDPRLIAPPVAPKLDSQDQAVAWARKAGIKPGDPIKLPSGRIVPSP